MPLGRTDPSASLPSRPRPAPPLRRARPRPDPPVVSPGVRLDKSIFRIRKTCGSAGVLNRTKDHDERLTQSLSAGLQPGVYLLRSWMLNNEPCLIAPVESEARTYSPGGGGAEPGPGRVGLGRARLGGSGRERARLWVQGRAFLSTSKQHRRPPWKTLRNLERNGSGNTMTG